MDDAVSSGEALVPVHELEEMKSIASDCRERHREAQTGYQASLQRLVDSNERQFERTDLRLQRVEDGVATLLERTTVKDAS